MDPSGPIHPRDVVASGGENPNAAAVVIQRFEALLREQVENNRIIDRLWHLR